MKKNNIHIGTVLKGSFNGKEIIEIIVHIHPLYGWIKTDKGDLQKVPQEVEKLLQTFSIVEGC